MTSNQTTPADTTAGRPVVLTPVAPGLWRVIAGAGLATLGPLFGFLIGSMIGVSDSNRLDDLDALSVSLMVGIAVGGAGVLLAVFGVVRLLRDFRAQDAAEDAADDVHATAGDTRRTG